MVVYSNKDFIIKKSSNNDYVLIRKKLNKHSHFNSLTGARKLIKMFYKRIYPDNEYLKVSLERICTRKEWIEISKKWPPLYRGFWEKNFKKNFKKIFTFQCVFSTIEL